MSIFRLNRVYKNVFTLNPFKFCYNLKSKQYNIYFLNLRLLNDQLISQNLPNTYGIQIHIINPTYHSHQIPHMYTFIFKLLTLQVRQHYKNRQHCIHITTMYPLKFSEEKLNSVQYPNPTGYTTESIPIPGISISQEAMQNLRQSPSYSSQIGSTRRLVMLLQGAHRDIRRGLSISGSLVFHYYRI